jgi:hypothetical protein
MTERKRILLAELTPRIPQPAVASTWNPGDKDLSIGLSNGNLTATKTTTHASNWGGVRAVFPMLAGQFYWETTYNYTGSANIVTGVADSTWPLTSPPGWVADQPHSVGGPAKNGACLYVSITQANVGTIPNGGIVRHWFDADAGIYRVANEADDWVEVLDRPATFALDGHNWFPIVALLRPTGTTVSCDANFGGAPFVHELPPGAQPPAFFPAPVEHTVYVGSDVFNT